MLLEVKMLKCKSRHSKRRGNPGAIHAENWFLPEPVWTLWSEILAHDPVCSLTFFGISRLSVLFYKVGWTVIMFVWIKAFLCVTVTDKGHGNHGSGRKRPKPFSLEVKTSSGHDSTVTHTLIHNGILRFI